MKNTLLIALLLFTFLKTFSQNELVDPSFGTSGKSVGGLYVGGSMQILVQPDGKIIQNGRGYSNTNYYDPRGFQIRRYNADGTPDNNFGTSSYASINFDVTYGSAPTPNGFALQADNKIIASGSYANDPNYVYTDALIGRYNTDGTVDNTFGNSGKTSTRVPGYSSGIAYLTVQPDGKILAAGNYRTQFGHSLLMRYNSNGILDNTFGSAGMVLTPVGNYDDIYHMALQSNGKIVLTGGAYIGNHTQFVTLRFNTDGTPDNTFGTNGQVITNLGSAANDATSILIQTDGKIVIAGTSTYTNGIPQLAVLRYNSDGTSDPTFNPTTFTSGYFLMQGGSERGTFNSILQQLDQKLVLGGEVYNYNTITQIHSSNFLVVKLTPAGTLDISYNPTGTTRFEIVDFGTTDAGGFIKFQGTNIILSGYTSYYPPASSFESQQTVVTRLLNLVGGTLPISLLNFTAQKLNNTATLVQWKTSSEINSHYFDVERSNDAINFQFLGKVNATGNSSREMNYSFTDNQPLKGVNYYRLKQVDLDGHLIYSPARFVRFDDGPGLVKYYPNPTNGILNIEITSQMQLEAMVINISNASGVMMDQIKRQSNSTTILMIDIKRFAKGTYFIQVKTNSTNSTQRIVLE